MNLQSNLTRRRFLRCSLAAAAAPLGARLATPSAAAQPPPDAETLTVYQVEPGNPQIWIRWANRLLTSYRAHPTQKYPYMYPLAGPISGLSLTSETAEPWPHHRSLWFGCDRLNGGNYWQEGLAAGQILSTGPRPGRRTPQSAEILDACQWKKPDGPVVCKDQRKITVTVPGERLRFVDWELRWTAVEEMTVTRTNHSLFAVRVAGEVAPLGGGTLVDSEGRSGERATIGKPAAWCGCYGRRRNAPDNVVEGIAILDHPQNPWSPCPWFTRDYGFLSPTPFDFIQKPWRLPAGESVLLRYRVVLHAGDPKDAGLDEIYKTWATA